MEFKEILPSELDVSHFDFWTDGLLLVAESEGKTNAMTIGWGGIGVMWGKPVLFTVVRPERFTHELLCATDRYSVCALPKEHKSALSHCGSVCGRDRDKLSECGLTVEKIAGAPVVSESSLAIVCSKLSATPFQPDQISDEVGKWYGSHGGYHTIFIGEIKKIVKK